ncbi:hypothetical protein Q8A67_018841 [Cirrhinus molitorella]|uniref:Uncharacterized protein n=1 Tax=Cirrhinus molitorella TaxID=172907 RepID=A0AA88PF69_9TELE|nr:hypothetical protein Q8A67_018821 [Cirrhinus molitorella]KAK2881554.1 hypothetical protein Q8A67_018822 [Cirrhinus molitorella]KAK2881555.1 hypothetical protein Q8A67_018823 [Cirrhinus molitorella]KAK2881556.1 hypothetical protein Q8A67_018824 [Cirrhinus molitorella]KAK2881557.1 hypothetical protein Q8A67_018825 [Cirrhinus molitorella]
MTRKSVKRSIFLARAICAPLLETFRCSPAPSHHAINSRSTWLSSHSGLESRARRTASSACLTTCQLARELRHSLVESEKRIGDSTPPCGDAKRRMACVRCSRQINRQPPSVERSSAVRFLNRLQLRLAGPYHLGESSRGPEGYRYLERASGLVLATAAHILKLDRYRED